MATGQKEEGEACVVTKEIANCVRLWKNRESGFLNTNAHREAERIYGAACTLGRRVEANLSTSEGFLSPSHSAAEVRRFSPRCPTPSPSGGFCTWPCHFAALKKKEKKSLKSVESVDHSLIQRSPNYAIHVNLLWSQTWTGPAAHYAGREGGGGGAAHQK